MPRADGTHLGVDPTLPGFGATVFGADPSGGHSDYWNSLSNPSLVAMGQIIGGRGHDVDLVTTNQDPNPPPDYRPFLAP